MKSLKNCAVVFALGAASVGVACQSPGSVQQAPQKDRGGISSPPPERQPSPSSSAPVERPPVKTPPVKPAPIKKTNTDIPEDRVVRLPDRSEVKLSTKNGTVLQYVGSDEYSIQGSGLCGGGRLQGSFCKTYRDETAPEGIVGCGPIELVDDPADMRKIEELRGYMRKYDMCKAILVS